MLAGSGDGPCANKQGGLGMYQFDAGTHAQTLAAYGNGILDLAGNVDGGLSVIVYKVKVCPNIAGVDTDAQAIAWLNTATPGTPRFEEFLTAMAWCYNGCAPGTCSLPGAYTDVAREFLRVAVGHPVSLAQIATGIVILGIGSWTAAVWALRRG